MNEIGKDAFHLGRINIFNIKECEYCYKLIDAKLEGLCDHMPEKEKKKKNAMEWCLNKGYGVAS